MPTERERKIDFLVFEEFMARLVESTSVSRCNRLALDLLRIRNSYHLDPGRFERVEIERYVPMARLEQRNFHLCSPSVQGTSGSGKCRAKRQYGKLMSDTDFPSGR
jgi:hypothetical protein